MLPTRPSSIEQTSHALQKVYHIFYVSYTSLFKTSYARNPNTYASRSCAIKNAKNTLNAQLFFFSKTTCALLDLNLVPLGRLQDAAMSTALLSFAEGTATGAHVQTVGVDETVLLEGGWVPLAARDGVDVQDVHGVDFLEGAALSLDHKEIDDEEEDNKGDGKDETIKVVDAIGDQSGAERDDKVEKPVRSSLDGTLAICRAVKG